LKAPLSFEAIIFDHDGTLVDTESADFRACEALFEEYGQTLALEHWADVVVGHYAGYDIIFDELIAAAHQKKLTREILRRRLRALWQVNLANVALMPHAERVIHTLYQAGYPLGVATASDQKWVERWMGQFELLPYFSAIATKDQVTNNKPAPDVYLLAAEKLGVSPGRCLVFEDTLAGVRAAKGAGMTVMAVPSPLTKSLNFSQADGIINNLGGVTPEWVGMLPQNLTPGGKNVV
jgi:HAD superfamily hydrolase (TIGR01509 family)